MRAIAEIPEPRLNGRVVDLLDPLIVIASLDRLAADTAPVLRLGVVESDLAETEVMLQVVEFLAVGVGQEEEVRAAAFGYCHGAGDWADAMSG